jgi:quinol monooxygenase YgiN
MVVEYIRYKVPSTDTQAFEKAYATAGDILGTSEHCLRYELSRCVDEPGCYVVRIEWDSIDGHMQGFRHSDVFQRFFAVVRPYVNQIEEMRHYEILSAQ